MVARQIRERRHSPVLPRLSKEQSGSLARHCSPAPPCSSRISTLGLTLLSVFSTSRGVPIFSTTLSLILNSPTTSGNTLIVAVTDYYAASDPDNTISDNKGNTWTIAANYTNGARVKVYYAKNIIGGANHQITIATPTFAYFLASAVDTGLGNSSSMIDAVVTNRTSSSSYTSGSVTTTSANELLFGVHHVYSPSGSFSPASLWLTVATNTDSSAHSHQVQDRMVSAVGSYASTGSMSAALDTQSVMVAFKATVATSDSSPPTVPVNLAAAAASATQINLTWTASTDNIGVAGYQVERCANTGCSNFALIGPASGPSYSDTNLSGNTTYFYRVRAYDAVDNHSGYAGPVSATTQSPDVAPPTTSGSLTATPISPSRIDLSWPAGTDNVGVVGYRIERCQGTGCSTFAQVATSTPAAYSDVGLTANTRYSYRVRAYDAAGNLSGYSPTASANTPPLPVTINSFTATPASVSIGQSSTLTWSTSNATSVTLDQGIGPVSGTSRSVSPTATTTYTLTASNGTDTVTAMVTVTVLNSPPTISSFTATPTTLTAGQGATLNWATTGATTVSIAPGVGAVGASGTASVSPSGTTTYILTATNGAGSVTAGVTVTVNPDVAAPSSPGNLAVTATSASTVSLSWSASTDNVGVVGYRIERCADTGCGNFAEIATSTVTGYTDTGLSANTRYTYRVRAYDAAANQSRTATVLTNTTGNGAAVTRVQHKSGSAFYQISMPLTLNSPTTSGNTLIVAVSDYYATVDPDSTISDNKGNSWHVAVNYSDAARVKVYYAQNITGGSNHQITIATSASAYFIATAVEYAGLDNSSGAVNAVRTNRTSAPAYTSDVAVTTAANALLFGVHHVYSPSATFTPDNPWVTIETRNDIYAHSHQVQDRVVSAVGSYASSGTMSAALDTQSVPVAFKVAATAGDGTPPGTRTGLNAVAVSTSRVDLSWTASVDNVEVVGYEVERCSGVGCQQFALIGNASGASYSDASLTTAVTYSYRVRAFDALSNFSPYSSAAVATTQSPPQPPVINDFRASPVTLSSGQSSVLSWSVSNVLSVTLNQGIGAVTGTSTTVAPVRTTTYTLTATNNGGSSSSSVTVMVGNVGTGEGTWTAVCSDTEICSGRENYPDHKAYNYVMPYATSRGTLLFYAGYNNPDTLYSNSMWEYNVATNRFNRLSWSGSTTYSCPGYNGGGPEPFPPHWDGHYMSFLQYDEGRNRTLLTGLLCVGELMPNTWTMDMSTMLWTELRNGGQSLHPPGNFLEAAFVYDSVDDLYIGYGVNNLLFYFDPTTNTWTDQSDSQVGDIPLPSPSGGLGKLIYNTADQHVYFFGGQTTANAAGLQNELHKFEPTTFRWTRLNPVGGIKPPKDGSVLYPWMVYDSIRNRLIHYIDVGNIWQYSFASNRWSELATAGGLTIPYTPSNGKLYVSGLAGYDPVHDTMVIMKASVAGHSYSGPPDVWELSFAPSADTSVPTAPTNLTATATGATAIGLGWTASTDNLGVTGYQVERCQGTGCSNT